MVSAVPPTLPVPLAGLVKHIGEHPDTPMVEMLEPFRNYEAHLRQAFAQDPDNELLKDPHVNVLPVFTEDTHNIKIRARNLEAESSEEKSKYIMPLSAGVRRLDNSPAVVQSFKEFQRNFNVFSESSVVELDWDNVVAAGSSVVNTLLPVPDEYNGSKRGLREFYHQKFSPASDVDLFLYGLTEEQAIEKIKAIEARVRDALLTETTVVRTKHAVTICSQYPTRHIQIVLRIYKSVSEILTGFDIDCSGAAYDGKQVYCTPRALQSYMTQVNHIDLSRRSPSYENRLSKYSHRGFEVYWPNFDRSRVDPTIFERSFKRTLGLAKLLVLERLPTPSARDAYQDKRREERGRPRLDRYYRRFRSLGGNIKEYHEDEVADWFNEEEVSNYHTFAIPYGEKFNAKRIEKLCYTRDLLLNAEWNQPDDREVYLHRHPAFFGRVEDVVKDCCGYCPVPKTAEEKEVAEEEDKVFVSGKVSFMKDDPGRQEIGSFNPLTDDDWTEMAYVGNTARLCQAIVDEDLDHVVDWLAQEGADPNTRDYTGRTPLHLAAMSSTPEVVRALVNAGARLVARVADGRTALHLAAARGNVDIVKILLDKSAANEAEHEEKQDQRRRDNNAMEIDDAKAESKKADDADESDGELIDGDDSDDEAQSMATGSFVKVAKKEPEALDEIALQDAEEEPDFYDINVVAWDRPCSALHFAIVEGHVEVVRTLVQEYGADVLMPVKFGDQSKTTYDALLTLVLALALPVEKAKEMTKVLLSLGATSAQADKNGATAFHRYVTANAESLLDTLWEADPVGANTAIHHIAFPGPSDCESPLQAALKNGNLGLILKLLDRGAVTQIEFEAWLKSAKQSTAMEYQLHTFEDNQKRYKQMVQQPLILALQSSNPEVAIDLLERGADPNVVENSAQYSMLATWHSRFSGGSALDIANNQIKDLDEYKENTAARTTRPTMREGADTYLEKFEEGTYEHWVVSKEISRLKKSYDRDLKKYEKNKVLDDRASGFKEKKAAIAEAKKRMEKVRDALLAKGAKTFVEIYPEFKDLLDTSRYRGYSPVNQDSTGPFKYNFSFRNVIDATGARNVAYLKLFNAAFKGDLDTIKKLTLASWDDAKEEAPLKIAVYDQQYNNPFSLAYAHGHYDVAKAVLEIAQAQYSPEEKPKTRYTMQTADDEYSGDDSDDASMHSDDSGPKIQSRIIDGQFTIDNVGQLSMKVNSRTKPLQMVGWTSPLNKAISENDMPKLKFLLDLYEHWSAQKLDSDDEASGFFTFPDHAFTLAVELGRVELLGEIIKRTGAGLPLEHLVEGTGVELKVKPQYYQGLTVYGKKRDDWAQAGRPMLRRAGGTRTSPLLLGAFAARIETVEWFLSDTPLRHYLTFAKSKAARDDVRLKHLAQAPGGFDGAISKWLDDQSELVLHAAIYAPPTRRAIELVTYLVKAQPSLLDVKAANGATPLLLAYRLGRLDVARILIEAGADQTTKDQARNNLLHVALYCVPDAKILKPMLDLLDRSTLIPMLKERNKLEQEGRTPLHQYCCATKHYVGKAANMVIRMIKMFIDISQEATNQAFKTLDGTGDTPLHTLLATDADPAIVRAVIDFDSSLLCCENAVGRTPAEVAHDRYLSIHVRAPVHNYYRRDESLSSLVTQHPPTFIKERECDEPKEHESTTTVAKNWRLCADIMARNGQPKRTLVSLNSANFVAKRLGEQNTTRDRYQFKLVNTDENAAAASSSSQDGDSQVGDAPSAEVNAPANATAKKTKPRKADVVSERYYQVTNSWARPRKQEEEANDDAGANSDSDESVKDKDEDEDDDLFPVCGKCGERHYRLWVAEVTTNLKNVQSSEDTEMS
jgi:ankyrin repeat protein